LLSYRKRDYESTAFASDTLYGEITVVCINYLLTDAKTNTHALPSYHLTIDLIIRGEDSLSVFVLNANPGIF